MFGKVKRNDQHEIYDDREDKLYSVSHEVLEYVTRLQKENQMLRKKLDAVQQASDTTPVDCTPGKWCRGCEFSKSYRIPKFAEYGELGAYDILYVCGKGATCRNFMQRE